MIVIRNVFDFNKALSVGPWAWPGGYPHYFVLADGEALSFEAAKQNAGLIRDAVIAKDMHSDWAVTSMQVNWEDPQLFCAHTEARIECAYDPEE